MPSVLALASLGILVALTVRFWWSFGRVRRDERGFVSQQWLAEHRQSQSSANSERG